MSGFLKKKGILFYNKRYLELTQFGILKYYDPKFISKAKMAFDLNSKKILVKVTGKK